MDTNLQKTRKRSQPTIGADVAARAHKRAQDRAQSRGQSRPHSREDQPAAGGESARAGAPPAPTLSHFAAVGVPIRVECDACRRKCDEPAEAWIARAGDVTLARLERLLTCRDCGERELVDARPLYVGLGRITAPPPD